MLEKISRTGYWSDFYVYPIAIVFFLVLSFKCFFGNFFWIFTLIVLGVFTWTFIEYLVHRFIFHYCPLIKELHAVHHKHTIDLVGNPTYISLPIYTVTLFLPLYLIFGLGIASAIYSGALLGALLYFFVHHSTHHVKAKKGSLLFIYKKHHALHHHYEDKNFSVTFPLWDKVFKTKK
ncbi:sterol desaturase family protein [Allofrancisella guangzhouensis]|nr:sterol desaturase family protein [Allofrancisella guangzhouensis]